MEHLAHESQVGAASVRWNFSNRQLRLAGALAIFIATFISYFPALRGGFIWDDDRHVSQNPTLRDLNGLRRIWFRWGATPQYYPMTHTSFWIEYRFWKLATTGYHIDNVILHCINALLLWALLARLGVPGAWLASAAFTLHPVNVESVAWISERKNLLATCFALASALGYLRGTRRGYLWALVLFAAALLSKTVVATLPAALLVIVWWKEGRISRSHLLKLLPMFVMGAGMGIITAFMERNYVGASGPDWQLSFADRVLIAGRAVCFYAAKVVWPVKLTFSYPRWPIDPQQAWQWIFPVAVIAVVALAIAVLCLSKRISPSGPSPSLSPGYGGEESGPSPDRGGIDLRGIAAAVLIYVGTLFPALGFFNTYPMRYSFVADHFQYFSMPAILALIVAGLVRWVKHWPVGIIVIVLGLLSWRQAHVYADAVTLWRDTIQKNPSSWMAKNNLAVCLINESDADRARGDQSAATQKLHEALHLLEQVQALRPQHEKLPINRADALAKLGRYDEALAIYDRELRSRPDDFGLRKRIAGVLEETGKIDDAAAIYEQALRQKPDNAPAELELGLLLARHDRPADAAPHLERYLKLVPADADAHAWLGFVYGQLGRFDDARRELNHAIQLDPNSPTAQQGLELLRRATGR